MIVGWYRLYDSLSKKDVLKVVWLLILVDNVWSKNVHLDLCACQILALIILSVCRSVQSCDIVCIPLFKYIVMHLFISVPIFWYLLYNERYAWHVLVSNNTHGTLTKKILNCESVQFNTPWVALVDVKITIHVILTKIISIWCSYTIVLALDIVFAKRVTVSYKVLRTVRSSNRQSISN